MIAFARDDEPGLCAGVLRAPRQADRARVLRAGGHAPGRRPTRWWKASSSSSTPRRPTCRSECCSRPRSRRRAIIEQWLRQKRGGPEVQLVVPAGGPGRELIEMAAENATETLAMLRARWAGDRSKHVAALAELQPALGLGEPPNRIECYDISNLQGTAAAGSMVVFEQGARNPEAATGGSPSRASRRQDDFASMEEVLGRRFRRWTLATERRLRPGGKLDAAFGRLPDLVSVDGGKGQLGRRRQVLGQLRPGGDGAGGRPGQGQRGALPARPAGPAAVAARRSEGLYLIQRVRDEAHRFALGQQRIAARQGRPGVSAGRHRRHRPGAAQGAAARPSATSSASGRPRSTSWRPCRA